MMDWNKTYHVKQGDIDKRWVLIDAEGQILGRLATRVAMILRGKHKCTFTPHMDMGDFVIVVNAEKVLISGRKGSDKVYRWHTQYMGGLKERSYQEMMRRMPERVIELAVRRMLPKNRLSRRIFTHLKVYRGPEHPHQAQKPVRITM